MLVYVFVCLYRRTVSILGARYHLVILEFVVFVNLLTPVGLLLPRNIVEY